VQGSEKGSVRKKGSGDQHAVHLEIEFPGRGGGGVWGCDGGGVGARGGWDGGGGIRRMEEWM